MPIDPQQLQQQLAALQNLSSRAIVPLPTDEASDFSQRANANEKIFEQIGAIQNLMAQQEQAMIPPEVQFLQASQGGGPLARADQVTAAQNIMQSPALQQQVQGAPQNANMQAIMSLIQQLQQQGQPGGLQGLLAGLQGQ
jgi:hypothetical protein